MKRMTVWACMVLIAASCGAAETIEVIGAAKVGDGSVADQAWKKREKEAVDSAEAMKKILKEMEGKPNASGARAASGGDFKAPPPPPVEYVVLVAPMPQHGGIEVTPPSSGPNEPKKRKMGRMSCVLNCEKNGDAYTLTLMQGEDAGDFVTIHKRDSGDTDPIAQALATLTKMLENGGAPLSETQDKQFKKMVSALNNPALVDVWQQAQAHLDDKAKVAAFVAKVVDETGKVGESMEKMDQTMRGILTAKQIEILGGARGGHRSVSTSSASSGAGGFSTSVVGVNGKTTMTVTIEGKALKDAFDAVVESVNTTFNSELSAPEIPADLAGKLVSCKLVMESADGALEKLAVAAGAKLESKDGKNVVVAHK